MKFESFSGPNRENKEPLSLTELERIINDIEARSADVQNEIADGQANESADGMLDPLDAEALRRTITEITSKEL